MSHRLQVLGAWLILSLAFVGCAKDPYQDVVDKQVANWNALSDILASVKAGADMPRAEAEIAGRVRHFQDVALDAKLLPPPDANNMARLERERERMQTAVDRFRGEMNRVKALPGGDEFFERVSKSIAGNRGSLR